MIKRNETCIQMYLPINLGTNKADTQTFEIVLAGDIGGTKSNLAIFEFKNGTYSVLKESRLKTKDYPDFPAMITAFISGDFTPNVMSFGVAGPIIQHRVHVTNVSWDIDGKLLSEAYNDIPVHLINDLEATAYGLAAINPADLHTIYDPLNKLGGNIAIIAPGTGLGEAGLYYDGNKYHPFATEGGHADFSPRNELDMELYMYLQSLYGHVSWERVVSGNGIAAIFDFLSTTKRRDVPKQLKKALETGTKQKVITENIRKYNICKETVDIFVRYLAFEAGNLALKMKSTGGLFIAGGIVPHLLREINVGQFMDHFKDFGRLSSLLVKVPVSIVLNERLALLGAAFYGAHTPLNIKS